VAAPQQRAGAGENRASVPDVERMLALLRTQAHGPDDIAACVDLRGAHDERARRSQFPRAVARLFQRRRRGREAMRRSGYSSHPVPRS